MRRRALVSGMALMMALVLPALVEARAVHNFACNQCHKSGVSYYDLGGQNICLGCHSASAPRQVFLGIGVTAEPKGRFETVDASNAIGSNATAASPNSHMWAGMTSGKSAAGASEPSTYLTELNGRYGVSRNRVTCSRCHDPHGVNDVDTRLLKVSVTADQLCKACHASWNQSNEPVDQNGWLTHPMVTDYATVAAAKNAAASVAGLPDMYNAQVGNIGKGDVRLVAGGVSCTSCHGMHFTDSNATTDDGLYQQAHFGPSGSNDPRYTTGLAPGDGHQLRTDGPSGGDKSALCQACHTYLPHGKNDGGVRLGCLECHSGHSYDSTQPNYFVLRKSVTVTGSAKVANGDKTVSYASLSTPWNDNSAGTANGYCERCHGSAETIPKGGSYHGVADVCNTCHKHNVSGGNYSFDRDANAATCGDCHGFPPYRDVAGNRLLWPANDGGYAYTDAAHSYALDPGTNAYKNEAATPHNAHAGGGLPQNGLYNWGAGVAACDPCHFDKANQSTHDDPNVDPGSYRDLAWSDLATGKMANGSTAIMAPNYKTTSGSGQWGCTNVYCHSNGGRRNATGAKVAGDFTFPASAPIWLNGKDTIVGSGSRCATCHGNTAATMASGQRNNSVTHQKHLGTGTLAKTYSCNACHKDTAASSTALASGATLVKDGGMHVNGLANVVFNSTFSLGSGTLGAGTYSGGNQGTCTVYCHSNGKGAYYTADWDLAASGACGTCHGTTGAALSAPHSKHLAISGVTCADCHGANAASGTHSGHVDGAFSLVANACNSCHGYDAGEQVPTWGQTMTSAYCIGCHTGTNKGVVKTKTAPDKSAATSRGHNRPTASGAYPVSLNPAANKDCTSCHLTIITNHVNGTTGDATGLNATAATCTTTCHGAGGSASKKNIVTHMSKACTACHDPHGDATQGNIFMIRSKSTGNYASDATPVVFTSRGSDSAPLTATNSYDEDDDGSLLTHVESNADDLCATCHTLAGGTTHNNRDNSAVLHHQGENCFTSCHKTHTEPAGAFISGGGNACNSCHGNPPVTGAHREVRGDRSLEETALELHSKTAADTTDEPRNDCAFCHPGADLYTYDPANDRNNGVGEQRNHGAGNRVTKLAGTVGYTTSGNFTYCTAACHLSSATDGYWFDKSAGSGPSTWNKDAALNCNACHYYEATTSSANNTAAAPKDLKGSHNTHFAKQKACSTCHTVPGAGDMTHITIPASGTDIEKIQNRAQALQDEATVLAATLGSGSDPDPGNPTCAGSGVGLGCHNTKTTPAWTTTGITCTNCHNPAGSATADPKSGLHNMTQAGVQKHDSTITGGCTGCHNSTKPSTHADGTWQADQAGNTESRFLNRSGLVYNDTAGPNQGSCFDNGASGAGSLDFAVGCHRDNGVWKRLWTTEADSTATAPGSARCKACHGQYENLNSNQGGGWNENTSHYLTYGGRSSVRGESHNSRNLGDASACEDCHSYPSLSNHENGSITMNDAAAAGDTDVDDSTSRVFCSYCHVTGDPLVAGTFTFTRSTLPIQRVSGPYDPIQQCNSCHGVGGGGRYWPVAPNGDANARNHAGRHEIHMDRLAKKVYNETVAQLLTDNTAQNPGVTSDTKQKNLCEYCHTAPAGYGGHANESLPAEVVIANLWNKAADAGAAYSSNQHGAGGNDTCAGVNCHNNKLTVDNSYGWYDAASGAGCIVCHTVGGANDLPNNNIHPNSGLHNITPTVSGVKHDSSLTACGTCHSGIASAMVGGSHINGAAVADGAANNDRGLFSAYTEGAIGTCAGSGVDNTSTCHADGGAWNRRWSTTASASDGATECLNCHGTFAGWRTVRTNHVNPYTGGDQTPPHDAMGTANEHPDCQICHGWGKPGYLTAWQNKTAGATPGHGDGRITMNGPAPSTGAGYNESTWGCAAACHSASWVMSDSGLPVNYGDFGGGSCDGCHGVAGTGQYWPNGSGGSPAYVDDNANSASRHDTHLTAIAQYKWGQTLAQLKANDANQKAACAFCHPNPGASGHNSDSGDQRVDVAGAGAFRKFTGSANDALDTGSGAYAAATRSCSNLVCHNLVTTPTAAADAWEGTAAANCTTLCHGPNTVSTAREGHQKHVVTRAYACTQCHSNNGSNYGHINGIVNMVFTNAGSLEQTYGGGDATYSKGSFAYNRSTPTGTCASVYCHVDKTTPAWNGAINTSTTGCVDCHTAGGAGTNPTSGLHDVTPRLTGKQHSSGFTYNGGASTAYCSTCHTTTPSTNHVDGSFTTSWNAAAPSINFAAGVGFTDGTPPTCGATISGCHKDAGAWKRKWHENSTASNGNECAGCHGDWLRSWNTGVSHRSDSGPTSSHPAGTSYKCKDCHALETASYPNASWGGNHGNGQITINSNGSSFARGTGGNAGKSGCAACHAAFDGTASGQHSFTTTSWILQTISGDVIDAGCNGCHGNTAVGVGQYWPDGTVNQTQYAYADDNATVAANHDAHITAIAHKRYSETLTQLLTDNTAGNPTLKSSDKQKAICAYCHPNPGGSGHSTDTAPTGRVDVNNTDSDNNGVPDVNTAYKFKKIIGGGDDANGFFRFASTDKACSNVACHAAAPFTPGWYGDTVAPGNVTLTAQLGPVPRSIKLTWTSPGDDGTDDGTAYKYDIRMGTTSAIATNFGLTTNYVQGVPTVKRRGSAQEAIIHNVSFSTTYYFALRTYDEAGNFGGTANAGGYASYTTPAAATLDNKPPVLTGSPQWYGVDSAKALDHSGAVKLAWTRAEDHSMPITYDLWWSTGAITYGTPQASTKDTSFRATGLVDGQSYNFAVRAKDAYGNTDTNTVTLQAIPQGLSEVPKTTQVYYANGAISGSNVTMNTTVYTATGSSTLTTGIYFIVNSGAAFTAKTNVYADTFSVYVSNANASNTMTAELGYYDTAFRSFTATSPAQTALTKQVTLAARAKKVVPFKFGEMRWVPAGARLAVKLTQTQAGTVNWGSAANRGDLTTQLQPVNTAPTTPTVSTSISGANVSIWWAASTDTADGVADTVHYDVYGSANGGSDNFPYVIATGLTTNATSGSPLVWDTQAAGIALTGAVSNVQVRVEAGDSLNGKTFSHTPSTSGNLSVNNSGDNVPPGPITHFKAETRPKQGSVYLTWTAPGDDGDNNGRAASYDIRYATAVIDDDTKFGAATQFVSEPYPDFGGNGQGYEVLGLADGNYYFAIKAVDDGGKTSPLAYTTATTAAGPKCGICHSTPPDEPATKGNHAKHGYTIAECANCHGTEAATFTTDHQDGAIRLGWKTATPATATVAGQTVTYYQDPDGGGPLPALKIYEDISGSGGFNPTGGDATDNGSCSNWSTQQVSGCHGPAAEASWDAAATLNCSACHGDANRVLDMWGHSFDDQSDDVKAAPPVDNHGYDGTGDTPGERKYVGAHLAHLNYSFRQSKGDSCRLCHGASRPGLSTHADGNIDVKLDLAAAGATAIWTAGTPTTAGTCSSMSPDSCHPSTATPKWDSNETFACTNCHGFGGTTPSHVTDTAGGVSAPNNGTPTEQMPGNCTWCHVGGHPKEKKVTAITKASPAVVTTENNHNLATNDKVTIHTQTGMTEINNKTFAVTVINATQFSLQGSNTTTYGTFDYGTWVEGNGFGIILVPNDSRVGIAYQSGGVHLKANVGARGEKQSEAELCWSCHAPNNISEWGADSGPINTATDPGNGNDYNYGTLNQTNWIGATWTSANFAYKTQTIRSTHSTDPTGTAVLTGSAYNYSETVDPVNKIRCSNCHDVHNTNKSPLAADNLDPSGPPYLRGTWKSNPYKEDGAPQQGTVYTAQTTAGQPGYKYGALPRSNSKTDQLMGGYWIDQNSGNPTAGWSYETSAGLCQLCHSKTVDGLDQRTGENLWLSSNGHANSVLGGSGTGAANIFKNGITSNIGRQGTGGADVNPNPGVWMGFQISYTDADDYGYGPRSGRIPYLSPTVSDPKISGLVFAWGVTVDGGTTEVGYHQFSCSKCHNPHASRLPKLMITNCLDVSHNTWDLSYDNENGTKWTSFQTTTSSWGTQKLSHLSTAQNCHRFIDLNGDNTPDESGWNKVTPW